MNYTLPYYGIKGTIYKIEERENYYTVYRYGMSEKDIYILEVPKNIKNNELLLNNYYSDLKNYLNLNKEKYEQYKNTKYKKHPNLNLLKIIAIVMLSSSIPLLQTYDILGYVGIALDILSIPVVISVIKLSIDEKKKEKNIKFIKKYNELQHKLRLYNEKQEKSYKITKYSELTKDAKEPKRDINKKLIRKKAA